MVAPTMQSDQFDLTSDSNQLLELLDSYIRHFVRLSRPTFQRAVPTDVLDLEMDELIQQVRIKLWSAMRQQAIRNPKAYIRVIVRNAVLQLLRHSRSVRPLPLNEDPTDCATRG